MGVKGIAWGWSVPGGTGVRRKLGMVPYHNYHIYGSQRWVGFKVIIRGGWQATMGKVIIIGVGVDPTKDLENPKIDGPNYLLWSPIDLNRATELCYCYF